MRKSLRLVSLIAVLLILGLSLIQAASETHSFSVSSAFGDRDEFTFEVNTTGVIKVEARWIGSASNLALILNGPGQTNAYQRADGRSPLVVTQTVTQAILDRGTTWKASIVNFSRAGTATGNLSIAYPERVVQAERYTSFDRLHIVSVDKTVNQAVITVEYALAARHSAQVYVGAAAMTNDRDLSNFGFRPGRLGSSSSGRAQVELIYNGSAAVASSQIAVYLYEGGKKPFIKTIHDLDLNWRR